MKKINLKKFSMIFASAMMLMGVGVTTTNAVTGSDLSQTVKADEVYGDTADQLYTKLRQANLVTPRVKWNINGHNTHKVHWYKKPHIRNAWPNINVGFTFDVTAESQGIDQYGAMPVVGTLTVNGRKYYLQYAGGQLQLASKEFFESPTLMHASHRINTYVLQGQTTDDDRPDYPWALQKNEPEEKSKDFVIPTHHNAVTLTDTNGHKDQYIPAIALVERYDVENCWIKKSDFDQMKTGASSGKYAYFYNDKVWMKNGKIHTTFYKTMAKDLAWQGKDWMSSKKRRNNEIKTILATAGDFDHAKGGNIERGMSIY